MKRIISVGLIISLNLSFSCSQLNKRSNAKESLLVELCSKDTRQLISDLNEGNFDKLAKDGVLSFDFDTVNNLVECIETLDGAF